jgi:hypothetical protein
MASDSLIDGNNLDADASIMYSLLSIILPSDTLYSRLRRKNMTFYRNCRVISMCLACIFQVTCPSVKTKFYDDRIVTELIDGEPVLSPFALSSINARTPRAVPRMDWTPLKVT